MITIIPPTPIEIGTPICSVLSNRSKNPPVNPEYNPPNEIIL